jgi:hypothetical protein
MGETTIYELEKSLGKTGTGKLELLSQNITKLPTIVKNLFSVQNVYLQVLLTRLTPLVKTPLILKPPNVYKYRLVAFHSFNDEKTDFAFEKCMRL